MNDDYQRNDDYRRQEDLRQLDRLDRDRDRLDRLDRLDRDHRDRLDAHRLDAKDREDRISRREIEDRLEDRDRRYEDSRRRDDRVLSSSERPSPEPDPEPEPKPEPEGKAEEGIQPPVLTKDDDAAARSLIRLGALGLVGCLILGGVFWIGSALISSARDQDHGAIPSTLQVKEDVRTPEAIRLAGLTRNGLELFKEHLGLSFYEPLPVPFLGNSCEARYAEGDYGGVTVRVWTLSWKDTLLGATIDVFTRERNDMERIGPVVEAAERVLAALGGADATPWPESREHAVIRQTRTVNNDDFTGVSLSASRTGMDTADAIRIHLPSDGSVWGVLKRHAEFDSDDLSSGDS